MIPLDEAQAFVGSLVEPLEVASFRLDEASGLVLAEDVVAADAVPPFDNTAMDGFAVLADDTAPGARLRIVGTVAAGSVFDGVVGSGEAVRIMTGAPIPRGADAVVMVEDTHVDGDVVIIDRPVERGRHVRPAGDDIRPGDVVLRSGTALGPAAVGLLATVGRSDVPAYRRPVVGVLSTGDELVADGSPLRPGQIRDSNRVAVAAASRAAGAEVVDLGLVPDDEAAIEAVLRDGAAQCDLVLSSGGVSMGDFDWVRVVGDRIGEMRWMQVAIRPAKPLAAGRIDGTAMIGLPGNPVSSLVSFELFARPAIRRLAGHSVLERPRLRAETLEDLPGAPPSMTLFSRVRLTVADDGTCTARSAGGQGSHQIASMALADGLAVLDERGARRGESIVVIPLD